MPRLLFLADTHLGFDLPRRPRVVRRRRGPDFFKSFERVLQAALQFNVDAIVHGGDLFFRSKIPPHLVERAFEPLLSIAEQGIPIFLVPGNHERSAIPATLFTRHPNIHIFDRPRTFLLPAGNMRIALSGFPFVRHEVRKYFSRVLEETAWRSAKADIKLLCLHQSVQGATVGPHDYVFRSGPDVVPAGAIPSGFTAVLCGHIHRHQVLTRNFGNAQESCPIIYPGSTERTSFAEKDDPKGFVLLDLVSTAGGHKAKLKWKFCPLTTRPMITIDLDIDGHTVSQVKTRIKSRLALLPADGIVKLILHLSTLTCTPHLSTRDLRTIAPSTMNVTAIFRQGNRM